MEDALVLSNSEWKGTSEDGLNPCFNGRCTRTVTIREFSCSGNTVLILVLMEDALVPLANRAKCPYYVVS